MSVHTIPGVERANDLVHEANVLLLQTWLNQIVFTWRWWILIFSIVLLWGAWVVWRDKKNTHHLLYAGFFTMLCAVLLDTIGMAMGLWSYTTKSIPLIPPMIAFDLSLIPIGVMFMLQVFPKVSPVIKAMIFAGGGSFIIQPLAVLLGVYNPKYWKHYYSFPITIVIYLLANYLYKRLQAEKGSYQD